MYSAFQSNSFQSNAYQILSGQAPEDRFSFGGGNRNIEYLRNYGLKRRVEDLPPVVGRAIVEAIKETKKEDRIAVLERELGDVELKFFRMYVVLMEQYSLAMQAMALEEAARLKRRQEEEMIVLLLL